MLNPSMTIGEYKHLHTTTIKPSQFLIPSIPQFEFLVGGLPFGMHHIYGTHDSGKTLVALEFVAAAQSLNMVTLFCDMTGRFHNSFATQLGVDTETMLLITQNSYTAIPEILSDGLIQCIVIDSLPAIPEPSSFLSMLTYAFSKARIQPIVFIINEMYTDIKNGGKLVPYYRDILAIYVSTHIRLQKVKSSTEQRTIECSVRLANMLGTEERFQIVEADSKFPMQQNMLITAAKLGVIRIHNDSIYPSWDISKPISIEELFEKEELLMLLKAHCNNRSTSIWPRRKK